jgi:tRNA-dihydrouridine synthase B
VIIEQYEAMLALYGTVIGVNCARKHIGWYTKGCTARPSSATPSTRRAIRPRQGDAPRILRTLAEQSAA